MKRNIRNKSLLFITIMAVLTMSAAVACAASSGSCGDGVNWTLDDQGLLVISGMGEMSQPSGDWKYNDSIKRVTIEDGVTSIGDHAFDHCGGLTEVTIPDSVTKLDMCAFFHCINLATVTIPKSITSIGRLAFFGCSNLNEVTIPNSVTEIGMSAFNGCSSLTTITIPDNVTYMDERAFQGCESLKTVIISNSLTQISKNAFEGCTSLTDIIIPNGVTEIGDSAFEDCKNLTNVIIPKSVTRIGESAFRGCTSLTDVTIPDSVKSIGKNAFLYFKMKKICFMGMRTENIEDIGPLNFTIIYCYPSSDAERYADQHRVQKVLMEDGNPSVSVPETMVISLTRNAKIWASIYPETPGQAVQWSSEDENIVRVDQQGVLSPVSAGTAKVTATLNGTSASSTVTVVPPVEAFVLPDPVYVVENRKAQIPLLIQPENAIVELSYTTGDSTYATIDKNGEISGLKLGTTSLTVTDVLSGRSKTVALRICNPVTSVGFDQDVVSVKEGETVQLSATVIMGEESTRNQLVSFYSDLQLVSVDALGRVKANHPGIVKITARAQNGLTSTCKVVVIKINDPVIMCINSTRSIMVPSKEYTVSTSDDGIIKMVSKDSLTRNYKGIHIGTSEISVIDADGLVRSIIPVTVQDHVPVIDPAVPATEERTGLTEGSHCKNCLTTLVKQNTIPKLTANEITVDDCVYTLNQDKGTASLKKVGESVKNLIIPDTIKNNEREYKVTAIEENACKGGKKLTSVTIGAKVTVIGKNAFSNCKNLASVSGGGAVTTIGEAAFRKCTSLREITILGKVTKIGKDAFNTCKKLVSITIKSTKLSESNVGENAFKGVNKKATIKCPSKKLKSYKSLLVKKGAPKTVKFTK